MVESAFLLLAADPNVLPQMDKGLQLIIGAIIFLVALIGRDTWKPMFSTIGEWILTGLRKWLLDKDVATEQKRITGDLKKAVEMLDRIQIQQMAIQNELKSLGDKNASILKELEQIDRQEEKHREVIGDLRERLAKLEGRLQ